MEIHTFANGQYKQSRDSTFIIGWKQIDFAATTTGLLEYIDRCELINYNKILIIDYWEYLIDLNLSKYFNTEENYINTM